MSAFKKFLVKAKLFEMSEEDIAAMGAEGAGTTPGMETTMPAPESVDPQPISVVAGGNFPFVEGEPVQAIFERALIPDAVFSAEKLVKVLDGIKSLDAPTRRTVVNAMDAADDTWTIQDALLDAEMKANTLAKRKQEVAELVRSHEAVMLKNKQEIQAGLEADSNGIRQQMQQLQQLLERTISQATSNIATIDAEFQALTEAAGREYARFDREGRIYSDLVTQFSPVVTPASGQSV